MRILFDMDARDYDPGGRAFVRPSVRGIIIREGKVAMVHSRLYDYYKLPGGGMEPGESQLRTLLREVREEAGLQVLPQSVREYGLVPRREKSDRVKEYGYFVQDNFHYLCEAAEAVTDQQLDAYEQREHFTLEWVDPRHAILVNRTRAHGPKNPRMLEREARVLECLLEEGYFKEP